MNFETKIVNYINETSLGKMEEAAKGIEVIWLDSGKPVKKVYKEKDWKRETAQSEDYPSFSYLTNMASKGKIYASYYAFHDEENITADNDIKVIKKVVAKELKKSQAGGSSRNDLDYDY